MINNNRQTQPVVQYDASIVIDVSSESVVLTIELITNYDSNPFQLTTFITIFAAQLTVFGSWWFQTKLLHIKLK